VKPRIFISYSSQETAATAVRDALAAALEASGSYTSLVDVITLEPGDRWRCRINLWLGACDAAVALLSETALASPYVIYENSVLAYRREVHDPDLLILPVLLGEVTSEAPASPPCAATLTTSMPLPSAKTLACSTAAPRIGPCGPGTWNPARRAASSTGPARYAPSPRSMAASMPATKPATFGFWRPLTANRNSRRLDPPPDLLPRR
jgi:hypothetical protein